MNQQEQIATLLFRHFTGSLDQVGQQELDEWLGRSDKHRQVMDDFKDISWFMQELAVYNDVDEEAALERLLDQRQATDPMTIHIEAKKPDTHHHWVILLAIKLVASLIVVVWLLWLIVHEPHPAAAALAIKPESPEPAVGKAILSHSGSPDLRLDKGFWGWLTGNDMVNVTQEDNQVTFRYNKGQPPINNNKFTITTPEGGKYGLVLTDGTKVQLNAATTASFAETYGIKRREVELVGQAYFEVASSAWSMLGTDQPFVVHVRPPMSMRKLFPDGQGLTITAWGTRFDIRANPEDSSLQCVLVSGIVRIEHPGYDAITLLPGEAYILDHQGGTGNVVPASELPGALAWKDGYFYFGYEHIGPIMQELCRWYNARVKYIERPNVSFYVTGSRNGSLATILQQMVSTGNFSYKMGHDTIYVSR